MKKLFKKIAYRWDIHRGRYQFVVVKEQEEIDGCLHVLEEVRMKELNRVSGESVVDSHAFSGKAVDYELVACRDSKSNQIIGCMRITAAADIRDIPSSNREYHLDLFSEETLKKLKVFTRLAILKPYRKTPAALFLMVKSFGRVIGEGGEAVLLSCEPNLFSMYTSLGVRPIGPPHNSPSGGYRIPMIFIPDLEYMQQIKSPALMWADEVDFGQYTSIRKWYQNLEARQGEIQLGVLPYRDTGENFHIDQLITEGLSKRGRKEILQNAILVNCQAGDVIVAENDGGKAFGIVRMGLVEVVIDGQIIGLLGEGDIFGELAFVLNTQRTATLKAADDNTEVLLFSISAVKRLSRKRDQTTVWQNLARVLAQRLVKRTCH